MRLSLHLLNQLQQCPPFSPPFPCPRLRTLSSNIDNKSVKYVRLTFEVRRDLLRGRLENFGKSSPLISCDNLKGFNSSLAVYL